MSDTNYITFIDNAGRTIFGEVAEENDISIAVKNPVMIMVNQQQNGQMAVQLFPLFFQEFVVPENDNRDNFFTYSKTSVAIGSNFKIEPRIVEQYKKIINPTLVPAADNNNINAGSAEEPEVIKLFDDE